MRIFGVWPALPVLVIRVVVASVLFSAGMASAQLAITEMMSSALKTNGSTILTNNSDYWELTNFGSNDMSLIGYRFSDNKDQPRLLPAPSIRAHESIVFMNQLPNNDEEGFRAWWGSCVSSNVRVRIYSKPGFSANGDGIRVYDAAHRVVDSVDFGPANRGVSFTYDTNTGAFGSFSILGQAGVCQAPTTTDIGSPGATTGPIPLRIVEQPADLVACLGASATFKVSAIGMPRPRYQWFFETTAILSGTGAILIVSNVTVANAGMYRVSISNGLSILQSSNAILMVDTNPSSPSFVLLPVDTTVVTNRTARFSGAVCAFPAATYQWFSNGVAWVGATDRTLLVPNCTLDMSGAEYCLRAANSVGTNTICARLFVTTKPDLRITEVQAYPMTGCDEHHDWFELTNFGTNAVDLLGYRFSDESTLAGSVTVTQSMVLQPRESAIFVKNPVADIFINWWGADLLPPGLKIFPYAGFSLFKGGDTLYLWNASAEEPDEYIDSISYATNFLGVSQHFDSDPFGTDSVAGESGAFRAWPCGDIGSPGFITNPPPRFVSIVRTVDGAILKWRAIEGVAYRVEYTTALPAQNWVPLGDATATDFLSTMSDPGATNPGPRFYRAVKVTP